MSSHTYYKNRICVDGLCYILHWCLPIAVSVRINGRVSKCQMATRIHAMDNVCVCVPNVPNVHVLLGCSSTGKHIANFTDFRLLSVLMCSVLTYTPRISCKCTMKHLEAYINGPYWYHRECLLQSAHAMALTHSLINTKQFAASNLSCILYSLHIFQLNANIYCSCLRKL